MSKNQGLQAAIELTQIETSIQTFSAKILESLVNCQLQEFLTSVLSSHQSGFRSMQSTVSAEILVMNESVNALNHRKLCATVFVDISNVLHTVDHSLLLYILNNADFSSCA